MFEMRRNQLICASILCLFCLSLQVSAASACDHLTVIEEFDPALGHLPESLTRDRRGNFYWSMSSSVWKRTPAGEMSVIGTLPADAFALGVKVGPDECVYTVSTSLSGADGAFVWRICDEGEVTQFAELDHSGGLNDLVFDRFGNMYVTDPFLGRIWKIDPMGNVQVWLEDSLLEGDPDNPVLVFHALGADGIVLDWCQKNIYVNNLDYGEIFRISINPDGSAGEMVEFVSDSLLEGADGMVFDKKGNLLVAVNSQNSIVSISPCGEIDVLVSGGVLDGPSSLVFGAGRNAHTLYLSNSAFSRGFGYVPGTPYPALLSMKVRSHFHWECLPFYLRNCF
jgi:sugar lactone lactonase YvrE